MCQGVIDNYKDYICILDVFNKKIKLYNKEDREECKIFLKGFKLEESRDKEFILNKVDK